MGNSQNYGHLFCVWNSRYEQFIGGNYCSLFVTTGNLFSSLIQTSSVSVGASGAIMGLMGGNLAEVLWNKDKYASNPMQRKITLGSLISYHFRTSVNNS